MTLDQRIVEAEMAILRAENEVIAATRNRCSPAAGWRDELKRRRAALAKLKQERDQCAG